MTVAGNAGKGREAGSRNKRTLALMALAEDGETPRVFALRVMRDETKPDDLRMHVARCGTIGSPQAATETAPLSNRLDKLEAEAHSAPTGHNVHIIRTIMNPDHSIHVVMETIIENGVIIRDDCWRALG